MTHAAPDSSSVLIEGPWTHRMVRGNGIADPGQVQQRGERVRCHRVEGYDRRPWAQLAKTGMIRRDGQVLNDRGDPRSDEFRTERREPRSSGHGYRIDRTVHR